MSEPKKPTRFDRYYKQHVAKFGEAPQAPLLEFGCGAGEFLSHAHDAGIRCYGIEVSRTRYAEFKAKVASGEKENLIDFFALYDGTILPYNAGYFAGVYSWFVLEHIQDLWTSLREIVRVTKPGGTIFLVTQDARDCYDGHCDVPWPLFLPPHLMRPYLEEFNFDKGHVEYMCNEVYYVTTPMIVSALRAMNCEIAFQSQDPPLQYLDSIDIRTEQDARAYANKVKSLVEKGEWERPKENSIVHARRLR